jgi:hypothetical protein
MISLEKGKIFAVKSRMRIRICVEMLMIRSVINNLTIFPYISAYEYE